MLNDRKENLQNLTPHNKQLYGSIQTAKKVGISLRQLYHWVDILHVVNPRVQQCGLRQFRRFTSQDLETLVGIKEFLERGYTLRAAAKLAKEGQRADEE